jgi:hypothetical protein
MTNPKPTPLSPAAQAVLASLTQSAYDLDPADIPNEAERHAGSSQVADLLDGVGCHPSTVLVAADDVPPVEQEITGNGSGASLPTFSNQPRVWEPLPGAGQSVHP